MFLCLRQNICSARWLDECLRIQMKKKKKSEQCFKVLSNDLLGFSNNVANKVFGKSTYQTIIQS